MLPWLILAIVLIALAAAAFYYWQTYLNIPDLFYTLLPSYEIPDVILVGGVFIENRGRQPAPNIKISIRFEGDDAPMIHHMKVESTEEAVIRSGGERHTFAEITARLIRPHGKIVVYWAAAQDVQPKIRVTSQAAPPAPAVPELVPNQTNS